MMVDFDARLAALEYLRNQRALRRPDIDATDQAFAAVGPSLQQAAGLAEQARQADQNAELRRQQMLFQQAEIARRIEAARRAKAAQDAIRGTGFYDPSARSNLTAGEDPLPSVSQQRGGATAPPPLGSLPDDDVLLDGLTEKAPLNPVDDRAPWAGEGKEKMDAYKKMREEESRSAEAAPPEETEEAAPSDEELLKPIPEDGVQDFTKAPERSKNPISAGAPRQTSGYPRPQDVEGRADGVLVRPADPTTGFPGADFRTDSAPRRIQPTLTLDEAKLQIARRMLGQGFDLADAELEGLAVQAVQNHREAVEAENQRRLTQWEEGRKRALEEMKSEIAIGKAKTDAQKAANDLAQSSSNVTATASKVSELAAQMNVPPSQRQYNTTMDKQIYRTLDTIAGQMGLGPEDFADDNPNSQENMVKLASEAAIRAGIYAKHLGSAVNQQSGAALVDAMAKPPPKSWSGDQKRGRLSVAQQEQLTTHRNVIGKMDKVIERFNDPSFNWETVNRYSGTIKRLDGLFTAALSAYEKNPEGPQLQNTQQELNDALRLFLANEKEDSYTFEAIRQYMLMRNEHLQATIRGVPSNFDIISLSSLLPNPVFGRDTFMSGLKSWRADTVSTYNKTLKSLRSMNPDVHGLDPGDYHSEIGYNEEDIDQVDIQNQMNVAKKDMDKAIGKIESSSYLSDKEKKTLIDDIRKNFKHRQEQSNPSLVETLGSVVTKQFNVPKKAAKNAAKFLYSALGEDVMNMIDDDNSKVIVDQLIKEYTNTDDSRVVKDMDKRITPDITNKVVSDVESLSKKMRVMLNDKMSDTKRRQVISDIQRINELNKSKIAEDQESEDAKTFYRIMEKYQ